MATIGPIRGAIERSGKSPCEPMAVTLLVVILISPFGGAVEEHAR